MKLYHEIEPQVTFSVFQSPAPLSKRYTLVNSAIKKEPAAQYSEGTAQSVAAAWPSEFIQALNWANSHCAFGYGVHDVERYGNPAQITVCGKADPTNGRIARTKEFFEFPAAPGILMLDFDPNPYGRAFTPQALTARLGEICPAIRELAIIYKSSVSACVHKIGEPAKTGAGFHLYCPVADARQIPEIGAWLFDRLWLAGLGFIALSKNGGLLERAPIDGAVFSSERLDFVGKPIIDGEGLTTTGGEAFILQEGIPGKMLELSDITPLTPEELQRIAELKAAAKASMSEAAQAQQRIWAAEKVAEIAPRIAAKLVLQGMDEACADAAAFAQAQAQIEPLLQGGRTVDLYPDFTLFFANGITATVGDVLQNPMFYNGMALADPVEGVEYGRTTAKFFANPGGKMLINSQAHGAGTRYFLQRYHIDLSKLFNKAQS